jgi:hypothetical protein
VRLKSGIESVRSRVIVSGGVVEVYEYERPVYKGFKSKGGRKHEADEEGKEKKEGKEKNRKDALRRARQKVRRIVNANVGAYGEHFTAKFLTLTFGDNVTDLDQAHYEFKKFIQRMNYLVFGTKSGNLRYTAVPEFQKRGAVHYHVIFYNLPYTKADVIEKVWGNGFIKINKIDDVDNVGAYICKYMVKDLDDERLRGRKCYFNSRGLFKPVVIEDEKKVENIKSSLPREKRTVIAAYENDYTGLTIYKQYNLNRGKDKSSF